MAPSRSGAGGKIVTDRRKQRLSATPYDRPPPPPSPAPPPNRNNWFTGLVIPSARALAGKIASSIFSEESETSSSEDEYSVSEDDDGNDNECENPYDGVNALDKTNFTSSEMMRYMQESQLGVQRTETKHIIEQLIMQETFSREECDRLVNVLNSRVSNRPMEAGEKSLLVGSPGKLAGNEDVDIFNKAVLEAKKWFQDKKVGSSSGEKLAQPSFNRNSSELEHVQNEGGSPVDVARSYMKDRPPWASPTKSIELGSPSTTTLKLFKEGTLNSVGHDSLSWTKKRHSLASGSWNIQEELRRVRSKATEDMLRTPPKIDPSWFAVAPSREDSAEPEPDKVVSVAGERPTGPESFRNAKQKEALVDAGVSSDPGLAALESRQGGKPSETPSSKPATSVSGNNELFLKTSEAVHMDECAASKVSNPPSPTHAAEQHTVLLQASKINGSSVTEVTGYGGKQNVNGTSTSHESLSAGAATRQNHEQYDNQNIDSTSDKKTEAYVEVPIVTETNSIASGGGQSEEVSVDMAEPSKKRKANAVAGKGRGRGRGRGK